MVLIALAGLCLLSVPVMGGNLGRLASLRLAGLWTPVLALVLQVLITTIAPDGHPLLHRVAHIATYLAIALFLWCNRRLAGVALIGVGAFFNALAITLNAGVMPASRTAERLAGIHLRAGFDNSAPVAHAHLPWLGDVLPWPGPLHNVLSVGDLLIYAGVLVLLQRTCGRRAPRPIVLSAIPGTAGAQPGGGVSSADGAGVDPPAGSGVSVGGGVVVPAVGSPAG
jgi:hypothetical protein